MLFQEATSLRAYRTVVDQVCDAIMSGEVHVGDFLPPEREIAQQTSISRTSVREALKVLADAGLLSMKQGGGGGTRVISDEIPPELLGKAIELSRKRMHDMFEVRNSLEFTGVELAAARANPSQVSELEQLYARMETAFEKNTLTPNLFRTLDVRFHIMLMRISDNGTLLHTYNGFTRQLAMAMDMIPLSAHQTYAVPSMRMIIDAIKRRNPPEARLAMASHIYPLLSIMEEYFKLGIHG